MKKRYCVEKPEGGGDCFGFDTEKESIMAGQIAVDQASETPGSKIYECIGDKCVYRGKGVHGRFVPRVTLLQVMIVAPLVIGGAVLALREMRKL